MTHVGLKGETRQAFPFLGIPSSSGKADYLQHSAISSFQRRFSKFGMRVNVCSLLALAFNQLYAQALNDRTPGGPGVTHFILLHDDVIPLDPSAERGWADTLIALMVQHGLGALSAAVAIKHEDGTDTSAAVDSRNNDPMGVKRITIAEMRERALITTREEPRLLVNTGCLVIDITQPWAERVYFHIKDGIRKNASTGKFEAWVDPEDWVFSRMLRSLGVHFGCTSAVETLHIGQRFWSSRTAVQQMAGTK